MRSPPTLSPPQNLERAPGKKFCQIPELPSGGGGGEADGNA